MLQALHAAECGIREAVTEPERLAGRWAFNNPPPTRLDGSADMIVIKAAQGIGTGSGESRPLPASACTMSDGANLYMRTERSESSSNASPHSKRSMLRTLSGMRNPAARVWARDW